MSASGWLVKSIASPSSAVLERASCHQKMAAKMMGMTTRQACRMCRAFQRDGAAGLVSKRRYRPSNHRMADDTQRAIIVRWSASAAPTSGPR
jgi:hypothetical protein